MFYRKADSKSENIWIRVRPQDKAAIIEKAKGCHLSTAEFMVRAALGRQTRSRHQYEAINELRRYIDLVRTIYDTGGPDAELRRVLDASVTAIGRVAYGR